MPRSKIKTAILIGIGIVLIAGLILIIVFRHDIKSRMVLAAGERAVARHAVVPLDLSGQYAHEAFDKGGGSSYWHDVPWRFQVFRGVPLQIDGLMCLWGQGNAKMGANFPEEILGIPVGRSFETLYVYHCAFFSSPNDAPVYNLVFRYNDGSSVTNQMLYGRDVLDFNTRGKVTPPTGANSRIAWVGASFNSNKSAPLRFILTALKNPQPDMPVATIDLYSCKGRSAGVVLAMTAGKSGMMK